MQRLPKLFLFFLIPSICLAMPIEPMQPVKQIVPLDTTKADAWEAAHSGVKCYHIEGQKFYCTDGHVINKEQ